MYLYKNDHTYLSTVNQTPLATDDYEDEMSTVLIFPTTTVDTSVENVPETSALSISTTVNTESSHQSTLVAKTKSPLPSLTSTAIQLSSLPSTTQKVSISTTIIHCSS